MIFYAALIRVGALLTPLRAVRGGGTARRPGGPAGPARASRRNPHASK